MLHHAWETGARRSADGLAPVLEAVWASQLPLVERRRVCRATAAMACSSGGPPDGSTAGPGCGVTRLEDLLEQAGRTLAVGKMRIGALKAELRSRGQRGLAEPYHRTEADS